MRLHVQIYVFWHSRPGQARMQIYVYIHTYIYIYVCVHVSICMCMYAMHACTMYACMNERGKFCRHVCM